MGERERRRNGHLPLPYIHIPQTNVGNIFTRDTGIQPIKVWKLRQVMAQFMTHKGEHHAVYVPGRRYLRNVNVGVGVDPQDAQVRSWAGVAMEGTNGDAMISTKSYTKLVLFGDVFNSFRNLGIKIISMLSISTRISMIQASGLGLASPQDTTQQCMMVWYAEILTCIQNFQITFFKYSKIVILKRKQNNRSGRFCLIFYKTDFDEKQL